MDSPPQGDRRNLEAGGESGVVHAFGRGQVVNHLLAHPGARYVIDLDAIYIERNRQLDLKNPFHTYDKESARFCKGV